MSRQLQVDFKITDGYESWLVDVPDEAPTDSDELLEWINDNPDQVSYQDMFDANVYEMKPVEVFADEANDPEAFEVIE